MPPMTQTCRRRPCSRPAPLAQPGEAPAPRPRSGLAGLPAHCLWPELTVATGSSRSSFVHTAPGYLCPCRHSQAVKPLWFGRTLTRYLVTVVFSPPMSPAGRASSASKPRIPAAESRPQGARSRLWARPRFSTSAETRQRPAAPLRAPLVGPAPPAAGGSWGKP